MNIYFISMYKNPLADGLIDQLMQIEAPAYAHFSALGTWEYEREPCEVCGWHWQKRVPPLLVQWEPSTDVIGDFSWDGPYGYVFIVKEHVAEWLHANGFECNFYDVEYVPPERTPKRIKCVAYPDEGPELYWARCETFVDLDKQASGIKVRESCEVCGNIKYTPRFEEIAIHRRDWHGEKMFRTIANGFTFVTEEGRRLIVDAGLSNISFTHAGEIVD